MIGKEKGFGGQYTLAINGTDYYDMYEAILLQRASLARTNIVMDMGGP